jgi:hypothetical protein
VRLKIAVPSMLVMTVSAGLPAKLDAQAQEPQLPPLTRGVTHETRTINIPGLTAATSGCPVSDDPTYGVTAANPIKVGGDMLYVAARSIRYLQALRGPAGEGLHFWRLGSFEGPDDTMLDVYQVEHDGTVHHLYVDGYRSAELRAPRGLVCAPLQMGPPPPNPLETRRQRMTLAATLPPAGPISLDADGSAKHGVMFDHMRLIARAFASAAAAGHPLDATNVPSDINKPRFVVVAYPMMCDGRGLVPPQSVKVTDAPGNSPNVVREARGNQIRDLVPGIDVPESALAIMYDADLAIPGQVTIGYGTSCDSAPPFVTLPVSAEAGRITRRVAGQAPTGITLPQGGAQVRVQVYFDFDGLPHFPAYTGGPGALADAAVAAVAEFRAEPPRVNGAPILQLSTIAVAFPESSGR